MGWRDLVEKEDGVVVAPWLGGRELRLGPRRWCIDGPLPSEHGWLAFRTRGRLAWTEGPLTSAHVHPDVLIQRQRGIPIGDWFVHEIPSDRVVFLSSIARYAEGQMMEESLRACTEPIHLLDTGLDRFQAVMAGRAYEGGPLVYLEPAMPEEAAPAVLEAWENGTSIDAVRGLTPALELAFSFAVAQRRAVQRAREEVERQERLQALDLAGGSAVGRRELAAVDFERAARAALAAGSAELVDTRVGAKPTERVVIFRTEGRRFDCVCHAQTLQIIDAGICLQDHATGRKDDTLLTLESLPSVIREAIRTHRLHVWRRVDDDYEED